MDARDLIPVTGVAGVSFETDSANALIWSVSVVHTYDGFEVGLSVTDMDGVLGIDCAERLSLALLRASMTATVWNERRETVN